MFKNKILNTVLVKSAAKLKQIPRQYHALRAKDEDYLKWPPVLCNSFPKSGTHLLLQILSAFPDMQHFGQFIASFGSPFTYRAVSVMKMQHKLAGMIPTEVAPAHLFYEPIYSDIIQEKNIVHYFIYRDPRDVAISEAYDITFRAKWHRLHKYFRALPNMEERISFSIHGAKNAEFPYYFPNIAKRFHVYNGWLKDKNTFAVRFEELVGSHKEKIIEEMVSFYQQRTGRKIDPALTVKMALASINPKHSHTFRKGKVAGWRKLPLKQREELMEITAELLIELGYESGTDWAK